MMKSLITKKLVNTVSLASMNKNQKDQYKNSVL